MNETLNVIHSRYSCRAYNGKPIEKSTLEAIGKAALASPSAMNRQGWRVIIVSDKKLIEQMDEHLMSTLAAMDDKAMYERMMSRGGTVFYNASAIVFLLVDDSASSVLDCGIVSQNVALAATSLGVDNCICGMARMALGGEKGQSFRKKLGFPQGFDFGMSVLLGFSDSQGKPHEPDMAKLSFVE